MSDLPSTTGDAGLDFILDAGPRTITPETPEELLKEIGKYDSFAPFREILRKMKLAAREKVHAAVRRTYEENQILVELERAEPPNSRPRSLLPEARIPLDLIYELEAQEKESWNPAMREDTLRCYPGLRLSFWRK
jgi:hypothetical protein